MGGNRRAVKAVIWRPGEGVAVTPLSVDSPMLDEEERGEAVAENDGGEPSSRRLA